MSICTAFGGEGSGEGRPGKVASSGYTNLILVCGEKSVRFFRNNRPLQLPAEHCYLGSGLLLHSLIRYLGSAYV
jgi:hypothetical protein